jgi:hypothetical protein
MKYKTKYYLFITLLVFIGLIIAVGFFLAIGLLFVDVFKIILFDLPFYIQFFVYAAVYLLIFPAIMVLISNVYFKNNGIKTWDNWLKIPVNYNSVITVIAVYQCAYVLIEVLVYWNSVSASGISERVIMFTVPFILFILSKKIIKKLFGLAEIEGILETGGDDKIDPKDFTIRQPVYALVIYIIVTVILMGIFGVNIWMYIDNDFRLNNLIATLMFLPLGLLGPFLIVLRSRWKLIVKDNQIKFTSYFGKTKSFTFGDITRVKHGVRYTKTETLNALDGYKDKKKLFYVTDNCPGYQEFVQRLKDEGVKIEW